jgi:methionyl-tRNA formyltransferase
MDARRGPADSDMILREKVIRPTVLATGYRGAAFVAGLVAAGVCPVRVVTYPQAGDQSGAFESLVRLCASHGIDVEESRRPRVDSERLVFLVGWQFLLGEGNERCVVFHDSLLPKLRGFSPTVNALLRGEEIIGVTALRPTAGVDAGPAYGRRAVHVQPGTSLQSAFDLQTSAMIELAVELAERAFHGDLKADEQDESIATYSLWRDAFDYFIDWRRGAREVVRQVNSVGFPYEGAKAVLGDQVVVIVKACLGPDIAFTIRDPGKLWQIEEGRALVVCGEGTLWIEEAVDVHGRPFHFDRLRSRFLTADTAWLLPFISFLGS